MRSALVLVGVFVLAMGGGASAATTHYLYYAGGAILNSGDAIVEDGTLSTDNAVFSVLVADVDASAGAPVISNWRAAGQLPTTHPTSSTLMSWMYAENCVHIHNGYLYVGPGDWNGDTSRETADFVAYAPINPDGSLGTFQLSAEFPSPPVDQAICATALVDFGGGNAWYYVLGGTYLYIDRVIKAKIQLDGSLGAWTTDTVLPVDMWFNRAAVSGTTIIHGYGHPSTLDRRIHTASPSSTDGTIPSWTDRGLYDSTSGGRWHYAITTVESLGNTFLVIAGGNSSGGILSDVKVAPLSGGIPGSWTTAAAAPRTFRAAPGVSIGNFVIIPGGSSSGGAAGCFADIFLGQVDVAGNITWSTSATAMLRAQGFGGAAVLSLLPPPTPTVTPILTEAEDWMPYR